MGRASDPRSSMSAGCGRAMKPGRRRVRGSSRGSMDGLCLLAARLEVRSDGLAIAGVRPSRSGVSNGFGAIRQRPGRRAASRRACGKRPRGAACLVETVTLQQHRARPGCPAPSPQLAAYTRRGESACPRHRHRLIPGFRPGASDRSPRPPNREKIVPEINPLTPFRTALTCGGPAYRFRAEFRPPPAFVAER